MKNYELITIFDNAPGELEKLKEAFHELLKRNNVEVESEEDWGTRNLHYEREEKNQGFFHYTKCKIEPQSVKEVSRELEIQEGVLQHMIRVVA